MTEKKTEVVNEVDKLLSERDKETIEPELKICPLSMLTVPRYCTTLCMLCSKTASGQYVCDLHQFLSIFPYSYFTGKQEYDKQIEAIKKTGAKEQIPYG